MRTALELPWTCIWWQAPFALNRVLSVTHPVCAAEHLLGCALELCGGRSEREEMPFLPRRNKCYGRWDVNK